MTNRGDEISKSLRVKETGMKYGFVGFMILLCCGVAVAGQAKTLEKALSPLEQTLISAERSYIEAAKKGDAAFFKRTLADDFSFVAFDGELADRQDFIDGMGSGGLDLLAYDMKVVPVADGVAIVTYDVVLRVPPVEDQGPPPRYQQDEVPANDGGPLRRLVERSIADC
jgi:hypothetical protein